MCSSSSAIVESRCSLFGLRFFRSVFFSPDLFGDSDKKEKINQRNNHIVFEIQHLRRTIFNKLPFDQVGSGAVILSFIHLFPYRGFVYLFRDIDWL